MSRVAAALQGDFAMLLAVEKSVAQGGGSAAGREVLNDVKVLITPALRCMYLAFEESGFAATSPGGRHLLAGMVHCLPDNKLVEDLHGVCRNESNSRQNKRMSLGEIQQLLAESTVLEARDIPHNAAVDRGTFLSEFPRTRDQRRSKRYVARHHQLPEDWSLLMSRKKWSTLNEETLYSAAAAFQW